MTRRERMENRIERSETWAASAEAKSSSHFNTAHQLVAAIPMGQPVLVGHHSENRHRRALERSDNNMRKACELTNLGARIRTDKQRIEQIKRQQQRNAEAQAAPNGITRQDCSGGYVRITFAEKPERVILAALKSAGFFWGAGSWAGKADQLPAVVSEMLPPLTEPTDLQQVADAQAMEVEDAAKTRQVIKTLQQWNKSGQTLDGFLQIGDAVDDEMADYFVGVVPPACMTGHLVQIGEPVSNVDGRPTYATLHRAYVGMPWVYVGNCHRGKFPAAA